MSNLYPNHAYISRVNKYVDLPIYVTEEFDFYRYVPFENSFYGKTVSELHKGNLRESKNGRYSLLFPSQKLSYWADSFKTARAEMSKHYQNKSFISFWSYDDISSTFPIVENEEPLIIIDGIKLDFAQVLEKVDSNIPLSKNDEELIYKINSEKPDCLAYKSHAREGGVNYLFFEKGFHKLSLREAGIKLERGNKNKIYCANTSDYMPNIDSYGYCFKYKAKIGKVESYFESDDYLEKERMFTISSKRIRNEYDTE